jgi:hypothetical protein
MARRLPIAWLFALALAACGRDAPAPNPPRPSAAADSRAYPPGSHPEVEQRLLEDLAAPRHPADGGGRAWLEGDSPAEPIVAGTARRFRFVYEAGPLGIAEGGTLFFESSPFWGWSAPQTSDPRAPGYTEVGTDAAGVRLEPQPLDAQHLLAIHVRGRALGAGERVHIVYGAGPRLAVADRFAERDERFWFAVDGDGDGVRETLLDSPSIDVVAGPPERLLLFLPATARPGETVRLTVALLDARGNAGGPIAARISIAQPPRGLSAPGAIDLAASDGGCASAPVTAGAEGVYRVRASWAPQGLTAESNPMVVSAEEPRLLWGDLHGHSNWSDGSAVPEDYLRYARDVAALDVAALTDHDHWGSPFLDKAPERWAEIKRVTERFDEPGRFVTLLGYEWTHWIYGHRHVLYLRGDGELLSSVDSRYDTPAKLWNALRGRDALTFAHHSAGGPVPTDWSFAPDPVLEPVTEIASVHGSSEALDSPKPIYDPVPGNFVRDELDRGYRFGFVGSGDSHDGHPGLPQLVGPSGGLAAIWSDALTREGVFEALRARRVYATNGPRIWLRVSLAGHRMGESLAASSLGTDAELVVQAVAPEPIERIDVVHAGRVETSAPGGGKREISLRWVAPALRAGEYLYVRVVQQDGGAAWSSPFYLE